MGHTKIIRSGNLIEVYQYEKSIPVRRKFRQPDTYRKGSRGSRPRSADSLRRASKVFRRIVRANLVGDEHPSLFTFTMYQKLSYGASVRIFTRFIVRLRRDYGGEFRYIAVPEFQQRGAVHWHVLIWGLPPHLACVGYYTKYGFREECTEDRQCERKTRYFARLWLTGFCDGIFTDGSPQLAGYLAKYLSKTMSDIRLSGKKAYYASRNILRPMCVSSANLSQYFGEIIGVDNSPLHIHEFNTQWLGRAIYKQYLA